jgi:hypothetical protein
VLYYSNLKCVFSLRHGTSISSWACQWITSFPSTTDLTSPLRIISSNTCAMMTLKKPVVELRHKLD